MSTTEYILRPIGALTQSITEGIRTSGVEVNPSSLRKINGSNLVYLRTAVVDAMTALNVEDPNAVDEALIKYAPQLAKSWHGYKIMADRVVANWFGRGKAPSSPAPKKVPEEVPEDPVPETPRDPEPTPEPEPPAEDGYIKPKDYNYILALAELGYNVMLVGPAGTGKTDIISRISQTMFSEPPHMISAPPADYTVVGTLDVNAQYHHSEFTKAYESGGIAAIDELDRAAPDALIPINSGLANGFLNTPGGQILKHPKCLILATANTPGRGADPEYVTANQLDAATLDRFIVVHVDYEDRIDLACANGDEGLAAFAKDFRDASTRGGVYGAIFSYRDIKAYADIGKRFGFAKATSDALLKGLPLASVCTIYRNLASRRSKYAMAIKDYIDAENTALPEAQRVRV